MAVSRHTCISLIVIALCLFLQSHTAQAFSFSLHCLPGISPPGIPSTLRGSFKHLAAQTSKQLLFLNPPTLHSRASREERGGAVQTTCAMHALPPLLAPFSKGAEFFYGIGSEMAQLWYGIGSDMATNPNMWFFTSLGVVDKSPFLLALFLLSNIAFPFVGVKILLQRQRPNRRLSLFVVAVGIISLVFHANQSLLGSSHPSVYTWCLLDVFTSLSAGLAYVYFTWGTIRLRSLALAGTAFSLLFYAGTYYTVLHALWHVAAAVIAYRLVKDRDYRRSGIPYRSWSRPFLTLFRYGPKTASLLFRPPTFPDRPLVSRKPPLKPLDSREIERILGEVQRKMEASGGPGGGREGGREGGRPGRVEYNLMGPDGGSQTLRRGSQNLGRGSQSLGRREYFVLGGLDASRRRPARG